jgi:hypothetical protein
MLFGNPNNLMHEIGLLNCLSLRTDSLSGHVGKQYNHRDYIHYGLEQVISGTCKDISHGRWG